MISLILAILFTVVLFLCFKEFEKRNINTQQAITFNYLVASALAYILYTDDVKFLSITESSWIFPTIALGIFFVIMFNLMAITTQRLGISIASMASKISLIIPVIATLIYKDNIDFSWVNLLGIILALIAVYLTFKKKEKIQHSINIAIILFFGAGILDLSMDFIQSNYLTSKNDFSLFIIIIFFVAFLTGFLKIIYSKQKVEFRNIVAGIILGVPNYFSIYFILISLEKLGGIIVFPALNIGVVLLSSILSFMLYKENLSKLNWIGISLACISILLILVF